MEFKLGVANCTAAPPNVSLQFWVKVSNFNNHLQLGFWATGFIFGQYPLSAWRIKSYQNLEFCTCWKNGARPQSLSPFWNFLSVATFKKVFNNPCWNLLTLKPHSLRTGSHFLFLGLVHLWPSWPNQHDIVSQNRQVGLICFPWKVWSWWNQVSHHAIAISKFHIFQLTILNS